MRINKDNIKVKEKSSDDSKKLKVQIDALKA